MGRGDRGASLKDPDFSADATEHTSVVVAADKKGDSAGREPPGAAHDPRALWSLPQNGAHPLSLLSASDEEVWP